MQLRFVGIAYFYLPIFSKQYLQKHSLEIKAGKIKYGGRESKAVTVG